MSKTLGVKLNDAEAAVFQHWCEMRGRNTSEVLGYVVECILKMQAGDAIHNEKLLDAMRVWDMFRDVDKVGSIIAPSSKLEVVEAIYFLNEEGKTGTTCVLVEPSILGEASYSTDKNEIVDEMFRMANKGMNRRLKHLAKRLDTNGVIDTVNALIDYYMRNEDEIHNDIEEMFQDNRRHEYGRSVEDIIKYKGHNQKSMYNNPQQLTFLSDLREHEEKAIKEAEDNEQGQELQTPDSIGALAEAGEEDEGSGEL